MKNAVFISVHLAASDKELEIVQNPSARVVGFQESAEIKIQCYTIREFSSENAIRTLVKNASAILAKAEDGWNNTNEFPEREKELNERFNIT